MRPTLVGGVALFIGGIVVGLAQLWFSAWTPEVFIKIEITLGAMLAALIAIWFTRKEYKDYKRQESNTALDK